MRGWMWARRLSERRRIRIENRRTSPFGHRPTSGWSSLLLVLIVTTYLLPKLLLVDFYSQLWIELRPAELWAVLIQDALLAGALFVLFRWWLSNGTPLRAVAAAALSTGLLALLLIDVRARQLWLRPLDLKLVLYAWENRSDLGSGLELFFNLRAGWGMTFRRSFVLLLGVHTALWGALAWSSYASVKHEPGSGMVGQPKRRARRASWLRRPQTVGVGVLGCTLALSLGGGRFKYQMQDNILARPLVELLRPEPDAAIADAQAPFDQVPVPYSATLTTPRRVAVDAQPFQRLVLVVLESFRWRDAQHGLERDAYPTLHRLAREGLVAQTYVPVPHSSKAYFALLAGRYPYPGIEMRESMKLHHDSFVHSLRDELGAQTSAFTSMHLAFENTGGLLKAFGFEHRYELKDLLEPGEAVQATSSFGGGDSQLYRATAQRLKAGPGRFVVALLPFGAHYPYEYPGKPKGEGASYHAYRKALSVTDKDLGEMLEQFIEHGLAEDTLFVFVGDHGEAFGEHGVFAHNSSIYDEEVAVPAIYWSLDGRLQHHETLVGRQIDVAPTILDLFGLDGDPTPVQGVSMLRSERPLPMYLSTFFDDVALGLLEYPNKFIYEPASDQLLHFDLVADPLEAHAAAIEGSHKRDLVARMRAFQRHQSSVFSD